MQNVRKLTDIESIRLGNEDVRLLSYCANGQKDMEREKVIISVPGGREKIRSWYQEKEAMS